MQLVDGIRNLAHPLTSSILTIGNFDGVHLGHRALIERVVQLAQNANLPSVVMTFEPHPLKLLHPERQIKRIFDFDDQRKCLEALGIDQLIVEPFSREFSQVTADHYLSEWVVKPFSPRAVIVGYDFSFGSGRKGSIDFIRARAVDMGFAVEVIPPVRVEGEICSSTHIRQAVESGDVVLANKLLGRRFYTEGLVERGAGRGRTIGIPTANLRTTAELLPAQGVYAAVATTRTGVFKAVVNIGSNPTFVHSGQVTVEAHLLDFTEDLYGEHLRLEFIQRLRSERKFSGVDELVGQIKSDIEIGRKVVVL